MYRTYIGDPHVSRKCCIFFLIICAGVCLNVCWVLWHYSYKSSTYSIVHPFHCRLISCSVCVCLLWLHVQCWVCKWPEDHREAYFCNRLHFFPNCTFFGLLCVKARVCVCRCFKEGEMVLYSLLAVSAGELPYWEKREKSPKHANCYSKGRIN